MKRINILLNEKDESNLAKAYKELNLDPDIIKDIDVLRLALAQVANGKIIMKTGIKIKGWTKDSIAEELGISNLDKRWSTFMDKIEKTYYE